MLITLRLPWGDPLYCSRYLVTSTYEGFIFRTPSVECNRIMRESLTRYAEQSFGSGPLHVIEPVQSSPAADYPPVRVMGRFTSVRNRAEMWMSTLVIAWFQDDPWPLPDAAAKAAIEAVDWEALATFYEDMG